MTRLTVAQALCASWPRRSSSATASAQRFFAGCFGIFGHGNVAGLGQALQQHADLLPYSRPATSRRWCTSRPATRASATGWRRCACTSSVGPGATNMVTGAALATDQPPAGAAAAGRHVRHARAAPGAAAARGPARRDVSVNDCFRPVSRFFDRVERPEQLIAAALEAMRVLTDPAETGAVTLALPEDVQAEAFDVPGGVPRAARVDDLPARRPAPEALARAAELIRAARRPLIVAGGGVIYSEATAALRALRRGDRHPGRARRRPAAARCVSDHPLRSARSAPPARAAANRLAARGRPRDRRRHALQRLHDRVEVRVPGPRRALRQRQRRRRSTRPSTAGLALGPTRARRSSELQRALDGHRAIRTGRARAARSRPLGARGRARSRAPAPTASRPRRRRSSARSTTRPARRGVVVCAAGSMPGDLHKLWRARDPTARATTSSTATRAWATRSPGGMGVKLAAPEREVFVLVGDGSYLMLPGSS